MTKIVDIVSKGKISGDVTGKIIKVNDARSVNLKSGETVNVVECLLQDPEDDETITFNLWGDECDLYQKGDVLTITDGFANEYKGNISFSRGQYGTIVKAE